jgi:hypothetical protein
VYKPSKCKKRTKLASNSLSRRPSTITLLARRGNPRHPAMNETNQFLPQATAKNDLHAERPRVLGPSTGKTMHTRGSRQNRKSVRHQTRNSIRFPGHRMYKRERECPNSSKRHDKDNRDSVIPNHF